MLRTLLGIALNRDLTPPLFLRCAACATIAGQPGAPVRYRTQLRISRRYGAEESPIEWICPGCGTVGLVGADEILANDTAIARRRTFLCRYRWNVPSFLQEVTCPRCYTTQPGPGHPAPAN